MGAKILTKREAIANATTTVWCVGTHRSVSLSAVARVRRRIALQTLLPRGIASVIMNGLEVAFHLMRPIETHPK